MWNRSFLILHGVENRRPAEHWQSDLAQRLREHGEQLFYPQLPDPDRPTLAAWVEAIEVITCRAHMSWAHRCIASPLHVIVVTGHRWCRRCEKAMVVAVDELTGSVDVACTWCGDTPDHGDPSIVRTCWASLTVVRGSRMPLPRQHRRAA
jgi:hypothetical protein